MEDKPQETKEKIVLTTIDLIEALGLNNVTIRAVTEAANVNTAAVNYHFGSKGNLLEVALERTLNHMFEDLEDQIERLSSNPEAVLHEMLAYILEGGIRFPNVTRAHLHDMFVSDAKTSPFALRMSTIIGPTAKLVRELVPGLTAEQALNRCVRAFSNVFFPAFFQGFFAPAGALLTAEARERYVAEIASELLR